MCTICKGNSSNDDETCIMMGDMYPKMLCNQPYFLCAI